MSRIYALKAEERTKLGTGGARELRRNSMVPAIIYGLGKPQVFIALSYKELNLEFKKQGFLSHMFDISVGKEKYRAIPKSFQLHPVTDEIEHIDFMHVDKQHKINVVVSIHIENESKCAAIKQGGILNIARHELEIHCLPDNIPEAISIDISELAIGHSIHLKDIILPAGVETKLDPETSIVAVLSAKSEADEEQSSGDAAASEK